MVGTNPLFGGREVHLTRLLRSLKNRFGPVDEVGSFLMDEEGLKEVGQSRADFPHAKIRDVPGSVLVVTMEGTRAFLVENPGLRQSLRIYLCRVELSQDLIKTR